MVVVVIACCFVAFLIFVPLASNSAADADIYVDTDALIGIELLVVELLVVVVVIVVVEVVVEITGNLTEPIKF